MQCPSCQFENLPGSPVCGRCGAQLTLSTAAIDVHPPRASARAKQLRRWLPSHRVSVSGRDAMTRLSRVLLPQFEWKCSAQWVFLRMAVPGWPQRYLGHKHRGRFILGLYLALLLAGLVSIGTTLGALLIGLALAVHMSGIMDVLWSGTGEWRTRIEMAFLCFVLVGLTVYFPVVWAVSRVVSVSQFQLSVGQFHAGDAIVLLRTDPDIGDVVLFQIQPTVARGRTPGGGALEYNLQGYFVDRIIAGPGQSVSWSKQELLVDGQPSLWQPLNPQAVACDLHFVVPDNYYGVLPGYEVPGAPPFPPQVWQTISCVPQRSIVAPVLLWHRPYWHWRRF